MYTIVLANCSIPLRASEGSLIVSDGDVELDNRTRFTATVVIARGNIIWTDMQESFHHIYLAAGGNLSLRGRNPDGAEPLCRRWIGPFRRRARTRTECPRGEMNPLSSAYVFSIFRNSAWRWMGSRRACVVRQLADWSPLATHQVRVGDVIRSVNGVEVNSPAAFRHELRRSILLEYAILRVERDREHLTRIVFIDGVPIDPTARLAPPPRIVKR